MGSPLGAQWARWASFGLAGVEIAVDEVGDDLDGALDVEFFQGLREQIVGDGGDAVALLDGKSGDGEVAEVAADQGDVGAVRAW